MTQHEREQRFAVIGEAKSWLGTPFRNEARVKGRRGGVDCGQLLAGTFENAGVKERIITPHYNIQFPLHVRNEFYVEKMLEYSGEIEEADALPGDVVMYYVGTCYSHGALIVEPWKGNVIHAVNGLGVIYSDASREGFLRAVTKKAGLDRRPLFFSAWAPVARRIYFGRDTSVA